MSASGKSSRIPGRARPLLIDAPLAWTVLWLPGAVSFRQQVIVALPDIAESRKFSSWLDAEGYEVLQRSTPQAAIDAVTCQPFDLLIVDSAFALTGGVRGYGLARVRETPVIMLGDASGGRSCAPLGSQIMFLERPVDRATFICMVTMAFMEARAERRSPRRAVKPIDTTVNGVPSRIVDVSREGVRLELPRVHRMLTPQFVICPPFLDGLGVVVQRVWVRIPRPDQSLDVMWCGGQLARNSLKTEQGWRRFVDTVVPSPSASHG